MSGPIYVVSVMTPAEGKADRLKEIIRQAGEQVKANEPGILQYQYFDEFNGKNGNQIVGQQIYKDQAAFDNHMQMPYIQSLIGDIKNEDLLVGELDFKMMRPFCGWAPMMDKM